MNCPNCDNSFTRRDGESDREYRLRWESANCPDHDLPAYLREARQVRGNGDDHE